MDRHSKRPGEPVIAIVGPTATGKTDLAIALANMLRAEIVSADSMQVYRYMDIGTAKPARDIRSIIPHHFIDILNPDEPYSAGIFARQANALIKRKIEEGIPLIIVGGTGLYIKALEKGLVALPPVPKEIQRRLWEDYTNLGLAALYNRLQEIDPATASAVHPNDRSRILRALGIFKATGNPLSSYHRQHGFRETVFNIMKIGLTYPREILYKRIEDRVEQMVKRGWLEEVETLLGMGYGETLKPMQAIGYKQLALVLKGNMKLGAAIEEVKRETKHLAKRQITWFRKEAPYFWETLNGDNLYMEAKTLLTHIQKGEKRWMLKRE